MPSADALTRDILRAVGSAAVRARHARRWSQRRLAAAAGISQSQVARLEQVRMPGVPVATLARVLAALDVEVDLRLLAPQVEQARQRDRAHARCVAYVARRLQRAGLLVATEVEVGDARWRGFIDTLAFHARSHLLIVVEVKTQIVDIGAIDRQLGSYERGAWVAAHQRGWRPRAVIGVLLVLATRENDRRLMEHRAHFDRVHPIRAGALVRLVDAPGIDPPARGQRGLAMFDPASRRTAWLMPTWLDGRRAQAAYLDRSDDLTRRATPLRGTAARSGAARADDAADDSFRP